MYPILPDAASGGADALRVRFRPYAAPGALEVTLHGREATVLYDQPARAGRALGALLAGLVRPGEVYREQTSFQTLGIMLDCSRNAVMTPGHFQRWLRQLALLGYNMAMLYTENTYALPGEDYFGYRRGRYSAEELREIDRAAADLGIEMIGCIQTLGHLDQLLRWPEYHAVTDTSAVLLVGEKRTYELIEKMIARFARCYRSRRIHIGMDETFDLGRGRYQDLHGHRRGFDLFNEHLRRVSALCRRHGLEPMLWSDMYFRLGSKTRAYEDPHARIPPEVKRRIPKKAQLVYWDYENKEKARYLAMIRRHRALGKEPIMASTVETYQTLWSAPAAGVLPCLEACREARLREVFLTIWGDDGAYCEFNSALAGLAHAADAAYGRLPPERTRLGARFQAVCGADYEAVMTAASMHDPDRLYVKLLWDDPLLRVAWTNEGLRFASVWKKLDARFAAALRGLHPFRNTTEPIDLAHAGTLLRFLRHKIRFHEQMDAAYARRDRAALRRVRNDIPSVVRDLDAVLESFRRQWHRRNKPFGFETIQVRLGGQKERFRELSVRLGELICGRVSEMPEFEERARRPSVWTHTAWRYLAVSGIL